MRFSPPCYLPTPHSGGGWRAQRDGRGRLRHGPLCGPGSEGSGRHWAPPRAARVRPGNGFRPLSESDAQPAAGRRPQPSGCSPVNPHTEGVSKGKKQKWHRPPIGGQDSDGASYRYSAPYTLCLFEAFPSRGNEKIGGTGYCVTYDTDSQSRNVLASPLGEEGHEVAKGWMVVRMIMILDVDVTAERRHYNTHRP